MKRILSIFVTVVLVAVCGRALYNTWAQDVISVPLSRGDYSQNVTYKFEDSKITASNVCTYDGKSVTASVTAKADISDKEVKVTEDKIDSKSLDVDGIPTPCIAATAKTTFSYSIKDKTLTLTSEGVTATLKKQ